MNRKMLLLYQLLTGLSDSLTGAMLMIAPAEALLLMQVQAPAAGLVFVAYIGAFVFAVGLCCLYGALLILRGDPARQLATVWLLTALMRASVAVFVTQRVLAGTLAAAWLPVAAFDGACVLIQALGLYKDWVAYAAQ
ncbi:MAG: hypothetical protein ACLGP3_00690 [Acidobacteriota bacterium]